jgi:hypothetical protein
MKMPAKAVIFARSMLRAVLEDAVDNCWLAGDLASNIDRVKYLQIRIFTALRAMWSILCGISTV